LVTSVEGGATVYFLLPGGCFLPPLLMGVAGLDFELDGGDPVILPSSLYVL
jgi:hypothetical protein